MKDIDPISGRKIVNNYEFQSKLGSGAHGTVKLGRDLETGDFVAIKIVRRFSKKLRLGKHDTPEDKVKKEVAVLKKARHPHVVSLLEVIDDPEFGKVYLILEYVERGEIVWRKQSDKNVAAFEMARVQRERAGDPNENYEEEEVSAFNALVPPRRARKEHLLAEQASQASSPQATIPESHSKDFFDESNMSLWHVPRGSDAEEENTPKLSIHDSDKAHRDPGIAVMDWEPPISATQPQPLSRSSTPHHQQSRVGSSHGATLDLATEEADLSRLTTATTLEGSMYGPYTALEPAAAFDRVVDEETPNRLVLDQTSLSKEEEEYRYVPCLTLSQALDVFRDTVLGLEYLHYQGIIHRDIKPANLLWTADYRVKISDFGVSYLGRPIREDDKHQEIAEADSANFQEAVELAKTVGTPAFYAPELCDPAIFEVDKTSDRPQITGQIDVWALGVTLYGMIYGRLPFYDENEYAMYEKIAREEVFISTRRLKGVEEVESINMNSNKRQVDVLEYEEVDDELRDLLRRLLHKKPSKRITLKEVKHHPWVLRGIKDQPKWIDETDPSLQSEGKKIEVSSEEVNDAVAPLTIVDRIKHGIRRLGSVVRGESSRKRAESVAKNTEGSIRSSSKASPGQGDGRRTSLRGDEQIFSALRASRENAEHPLSHSVAPSPSPRSDQERSYFGEDLKSSDSVSRASSVSSHSAQRPAAPDRAISTTDSMRTVRGPTHTRPISPPSNTDPLPYLTTVTESTTNLSSHISGLFGGAGRRIANSMHSRERGRGHDTTSQTSRSSSIDNLASIASEDPHASPSIAFSSASATGHVDQPSVLRDISPGTTTNPSSANSSRPQSTFLQSPTYLPDITTTTGFARAQEQNTRRHLHESAIAAESTPSPARPRANTAVQHCPPSPDDDIFFARGPVDQPQVSSTNQDAIMAVSSDDQMTSGISESFSHPSIPSVVSGASSVEGAVGGAGLGAPGLAEKRRASGGVDDEEDEAEAGYIGDGDGNEEESDDDGGIVFGAGRRSR